MAQSQVRIKVAEFFSSIPHRYPTGSALCILYLPIVLFIGPMLVSEGYLFKGDVSFNFAPFTTAGMEQWKNGIIPFWSHFVQCGFSLLGDGMGALLYPPLILTYLLFPLGVSYNIDIGIHIIIAAFVMFSFCKSLGITNTGAILASWLWIFTGPIMDYLGSPAIHGITWLPLILLLIDRLFVKQNFLISVAFLSVIYGLGWVGGLPQIPVYNSMISLGYFLFRIYLKRDIGIRSIMIITTGWIVAVLLGIGIGAIQLLPTLENGAHSIRAGGVDYTFATYGSLFPAGIAGFIFPAWTHLAGYWLSGPNLFAGYLVIGLVLLTLHKKQETKVVYFFWILLCIGCFLSFGKFNPLYKLIYHLPGLHFLRVPSRLLIFSQFSLCMLSAFGLNSICTITMIDNKRIKIIELFKKTAYSLAFALAAMLMGNIFLRLARQPLFNFAQKYVNRSMGNSTYSLQDAEFYQHRIITMFNDLSTAINPAQYRVVVSLLATIGALCVIVAWMKKGGKFRICYPLLFFCLINIVIFVPKPSDALRQKKSPPSRLTEYLTSQKGLFRIYNVNYRENVAVGCWSEEKLDPSFNMFHHIDNVGVYSSLGVKRYYELMGKLGAANLAFGIQSVTDTIVGNHKSLLDFMNVKYVTSDRELTLPALEKIAIGGPPFLYENKSVFPRAFLVPHAQAIQDSCVLLQKLHSSDFKPERVVYLESPPEKIPVASEDTLHGYSVPVIVSYDNNRVIIDAEGPGWLVLSDLFYPGWKATVNGVTEKIYRANYVFRSIPLDAGKKHIVFEYASAPFKRGAIICMFSLAIVGVLLLYQFIVTRNNNHRQRREGFSNY